MQKPKCYREADLDYCATSFDLRKGDEDYKPECDITGDDHVSIKDLQEMASNLCVEPECYTMEDLNEATKLRGKTRADPEWNSFYDTNEDGKVGIKDLQYMGEHICSLPPVPEPPERIQLPHLAVENSDICLMPLHLPAGSLAKLNIGITTLNVPPLDLTLIPKICVPSEWMFNSIMGFLDHLAREFYASKEKA